MAFPDGRLRADTAQIGLMLNLQTWGSALYASSDLRGRHRNRIQQTKHVEIVQGQIDASIQV